MIIEIKDVRQPSHLRREARMNEAKEAAAFCAVAQRSSRCGGRSWGALWREGVDVKSGGGSIDDQQKTHQNRLGPSDQ